MIVNCTSNYEPENFLVYKIEKQALLKEITQILQFCMVINTYRAGLRDIRTLISAKKTAIFSCLTNALAPLPIALESCSTAQTDRPV